MDIKSAYLPGKAVNGFNTSSLHFIQNDIVNNLDKAFNLRVLTSLFLQLSNNICLLRVQVH